MTKQKYLAVVVILALMAASPALAQEVDLSPVQNVLQSIIDAITGTLGIAIGTLALMGVFLGWFFGFIDWSRALYVLIGVVGIAAAPAIIATVFSAA